MLSAAQRYVLSRSMSAAHQRQLLARILRLERWAGKPVHRHEMTLDTANAWLAELEHSGLQPETVNGYRRSLICVWRFATPDSEPIPRFDRIRKAKEPDKVKHGFRHEEIRQLIATAAVMTTTRADGVPWRYWWPAYLLAAYNTGQYVSDLRRLAWSDVHTDGTVLLVRHKTGRLIRAALEPLTIEACRTIGHKSLLLPWPFTMKSFCEHFKRLVKLAGVREGTAKWIRRSAISYAEREQPGAGRIIAGHASEKTTNRHYRDWTIAPAPVVRPPSLEG